MKKLPPRLILGGVVVFCVSLACSLPISGQQSPSPAPAETRSQEMPLPLSATETSLPTPPPRNSLPTAEPGKIQREVNLPETQIHDLWVSPKGQVYVSGESGLYQFNGNRWDAILKEPVTAILGMDAAWQLWVLTRGGLQVAAYDGSQWRKYAGSEGWAALPGSQYLSQGIGDSLAVDAQGNLWLATGLDSLRQFSPKSGRWKEFTARDLGLTRSEEGYQGHFLSDVLASSSGEVWVSDCEGLGEDISGQGVLRLQGETWVSEAFTQKQCVYDMEIDDSGKVWAAGFNALMMYDPIRQEWSRFDLPAFDRRQVVVGIDLDPLGNPWVEVLRGGGASVFGAATRFHLEGSTWHQDLKDYPPSASSITFLPDGQAYICVEGALYQAARGAAKQVGTLDTLACQVAVDGSGRLWIAVQEGPDAGLWWMTP